MNRSVMQQEAGREAEHRRSTSGRGKECHVTAGVDFPPLLE